MKNDLHKTFGQIFDNDIEAFRSELMRVQAHQANRKEAEEWVERLRFLDISKVPKLYHKHCSRDSASSKNNPQSDLAEQALPELHIPITEQNYDNGRIPYIAVSWKWGTGRGANIQQKPLYDYKIQRPNAAPHKSEFPDEYLQRVIMFAQERKITKLWIDKECIYQRKEDGAMYPKDKDLGVQIMDIVYGCSPASVGLLTTPLVTQDEIDILDSLITKTVFSMADEVSTDEASADESSTDDPQFSLEFSGEAVDVREVQMLILKILSDERWSRGWIFQEDHLASSDMTLLIPYDYSLHTRLSAGFGCIPGELQVNLKSFREAVTMFCLASKQEENSWPTSEILSKAKQYKIWNKRAYTPHEKRRWKRPVYLWSDEGWKDDVGGAQINFSGNYQDVNFYPTMTNSVLADICSRSVDNEEDRIAILANALKFPKRLDTSPASPIVKTGQYSLSVAMLAQILMNGEILRNSETHFQPSAQEFMQHTLQSYLSRCEFHFNAPSFKFEQSFIQRCRFRSPTITRRGIETKGFLFKILPDQDEALQLTPSDRAKLVSTSRNPHARRLPKHRKLNLVAHTAIRILADKLDHIWPACRLASYLRQHLQHDLNVADDAPRSTSSSTAYVLDMLSAVYQALRDGRALSLACAPDSTVPSAIFIGPPRAGWATQGPARFVFTSWDGPCSEYDRERIASLEVGVCGENGGEGLLLRSFGWVNGVFDFRGRALETWCFPLPGITEGSGKRECGRMRERKRKREGDADGV